MTKVRPVTERELRQKLRMIISHASGGHLSEPKDVDRSVNDICVEISRHHNRIWEHAQESAPEAARLRAALKRLFEAEKFHDPDDWRGEPAMIEAAQVLGEPPFDNNPLTEAETNELVERINANPNLHPLPSTEAAKLREALDALAQAEATYRYAHDVLGTGDPKTGRAWDLMKRAGDKARAALNPSPALVGDEGGGTSSR
jgi:hypothetical protein